MAAKAGMLVHELQIQEEGAREVGDRAVTRRIKEDLEAARHSLGSEDGVAHEKAALVRSLSPDGRAVLNADDPRVAAMAKQTTAVTLRFSSSDPRADIWGCEARRTPRGSRHQSCSAAVSLPDRASRTSHGT